MNFQSKCEVIGKWGCLLLCYAYIVGVKEQTVFDKLEEMMQKKLIDKECTVLDAEGVIYFLSKKKKTVTKENTIPTGLYACKYEYNDMNGVYHAHWVVKKGTEIVYNSLDVSQCVKQGTVARILPFRKVA